MITKYVGSPIDLINCTKLAIVETPTILLESDIPKYTPEYQGFYIKAFISKVDGKFKYSIESGSSIVFNAIIMYFEDSTPIGFTMLDSTIDTAEYRIQSIGVLLNFMINGGDSYVEIDAQDIFYDQHLINTKSVHKNLLGKTAISIDNLPEYRNESSFGNTINDLSNDKFYRYSGSLMKGVNIINPISLTTLDLEQIKLLKIKGRYYAIGWNDEILSVQDESNVVTTIDMTNYGRIHKLGANYLVIETTDPETNNEVFSIYNTELFISESPRKLPLINIPTKYKFVEDYSTGNLCEYLIQNESIITRTQFLEDLLSRYPIPEEDLQTLINLDAVMPGLIVYTIKTNEGSFRRYITDVKINGSNRIEYNLPHEVVTCLSNKAIIVKRGSSSSYYVLVSIEPVEILRLNKEYKVVYYNLGSEGNWRRLDLLSKHQVDPKSVKILMTSVEGSLFRYTEDNGSLILSAL